MKMRLLALVVANALLLCGCCTCDTQVEQLQQQVTELESQLTAITVTEPYEPSTDESDDMSSFLDVLLNSNEYTDLESVATCEEATLDHLLRCAEKCVCTVKNEYWARRIAKKLVSHSNATGDVVKVLSNSKYSLVWFEIADADCNDDESLVAVAKKCSNIDDDPYRARETAKKLVSHPNFTAEVAMELANSTYTTVKDLAHKALESLKKT